jgi:TonB family protein
MKENVNYPSLERDLGLSGTVYVYFIINKQGKVEDAKVIRGVRGAKGLDEEALRVIRNMPDWTPGSHGGKPVKVQFTYPVSFRLK